MVETRTGPQGSTCGCFVSTSEWGAKHDSVSTTHHGFGNVSTSAHAAVGNDMHIDASFIKVRETGNHTQQRRKKNEVWEAVKSKTRADYHYTSMGTVTPGAPIAAPSSRKRKRN